MTRRHVKLVSFGVQSARSRAYRNMSALQRMSQKETYLRGIGQGIVFLLIGCVIMGLNVQKVGGASFMADLQDLPEWVWVLGGGTCSFGLCWAFRNAWLFASLMKMNRKMGEEEKLPGKLAD